MHIPDGYLGPQTYVPALAAMTAFWAVGARKVTKTLRARQVPMLALGAAFTFVAMMFNVPIPGGTTGHAVGGALVAILLGPWAAMVAVSLAVILQALLFGDGGITAIGANCLNMAVVLPFTAWWTYRLLAGASPGASRQVWAAAAAGYVGLNAAALTTAVMFGIQPSLARDAAGRPLYCPFGLNVAVPTMALEHLLLFGFVEAAATALVVRYLQRTAPETLPSAVPVTGSSARGKATVRRLAWGLGILALLTPIGLWLPEKLGAGAAWGEWGAEELRELVGRVPTGIAEAEGKWKAPLPDYSTPGQEEAPLARQSFVYVASAVLGMACLWALTMALRRHLSRAEGTGDA